ncbi:MAG: glycosyltransferase [Bacteroidales bacterium]|nr:glycosyltransferase [Bacteroidales bacterium]
MAGEKKYLVFGDAESIHLLKWVKELQKYFEVIVVSSLGFMPEIDELLAEDRKYAFKIKQNENGASTGFLGKLQQLQKIINRTKPHYVNAHYISSHGLLVALAKVGSKHKFKFIASAWGTDVLVFPWKNKVFFQVMKFILSKADWITSDSEYMSSVIKKIKHKEVLTFTFGLDSLPTYEQTKYDENLFFSNRGLSPNYNIDWVLNVFANIYKNEPQSRLIVSNDGEEKESLIKQCQELGLEKAVEFVGFLKEQEQIKIYTKACGYFSLPSSDSTSVSLLEAMAYGCIPILSDIPANREWVNDGENGLIIKQDISYEKLKALKNNRKQIAENNRKTIAEKAIFPDLIGEFVQKICGTL